MDILGDTLEKIAYEKAGIIKQNIPVVIGEALRKQKKFFLIKPKKKMQRFFLQKKNTKWLL